MAPPGGLNGFMNNRPGNPPNSRPQSANSRRQAAGANAKVEPPKTMLKPEPVQQQTAIRRPPANNINYSAGQPNQGQKRESGETNHGRNDFYGTDAGSSIDTTINGQSMLQEEQGRRTDSRRYPQDHGHDLESESSGSGSDEQSGEGEGEDEDEGDFQDHEDNQSLQLGHNYNNEAQRAWVQAGVFAEGNSYPSTTSGPPDDLTYQWNLGQQLPVGNLEVDGPSEPAQQQASKGHSHRQTQAPTQRFNNPAAGPSTMPGSTIFDKGAGIRASEQRSKPGLSVRGGRAQQSNAAAALPNQPQTASQGVQSAPRPANAAPDHRMLANGGQPVQRDTRALSGPPPGPSTMPMQKTSAGRPLVAHSAHLQPQTQFKREATAHYDSIEQDPAMEVEAPIEDYDIPELFEKTYDQLRAENFDHEPRGANKVVSEDMQQRVLEERLVHVQKNFNPGDQSQFFRALPTREWEDAGDWFLERFSSIIGRAKDARKNKRKLAQEFEDEVEKRHRHVAKRQQNVETALDGMKTKGQGLIPKSPRASKEPVSRTPRSRKR